MSSTQMKSFVKSLSAKETPKQRNKSIEINTSAKNSPRNEKSNPSKASTGIKSSARRMSDGKIPYPANTSTEKQSSVKPLPAGNKRNPKNTPTEIKSSVKASPQKKPNLPNTSINIKSSVKGLPAGISNKSSKTSIKVQLSEKDSPSKKPNQSKVFSENKSSPKGSLADKKSNMATSSKEIKDSNKKSPAGIKPDSSKASLEIMSSVKDSPKSKIPKLVKTAIETKASGKNSPVGVCNPSNISTQVKSYVDGSPAGKIPIPLKAAIEKKSSVKDLPSNNKSNPSKPSTEMSSPIKNTQSAKKPYQSNAFITEKSSDEDSSSSIKPNQNKKFTPVNSSLKSVLPNEKNQKLTKTSKEIKSSNTQSLTGNKSKTFTNIKSSEKEVLLNKNSNQSKSAALRNSSNEKSPKSSQFNQSKEIIISSQDTTLFDEEHSAEFKAITLEFSPSKITGEDSDLPNRKLSFRKISMEVASSLPLENDSEEEEDDDVLGEKADTSVCKSSGKESEPAISSSVTSMTKEQIDEHISCCLQLNTENKINTKNAFALKLIDCMTILMKSSAQDESNFAAVACQLDAGAKIYSHRVDAVHQQALKLAESCLFAEKKDKKKKDKDSEDEGDEEQNGETSEKAKRKKAKKKILAAPEQTTRKLKGKDPRENYVQLEARPGGIIEKARRDPKDLSFTLEKHVPFWHDGPGTSVGGFVKIPNIELKSREITPGLDMESLLKYIPKRRPPSPETSTSTENDIPQLSSTADCEDSRPASPLSDSLPPPPNSCESDYDEDDESIKLPVETSEKLANAAASREVHIVSLAESRMSKEMASMPSRLDVIKALFHTEGENDYNYLKMDCKEYWAGPSHWKRPQGVNAAAYKKKSIRKRKEPVEIKYDKESDLKKTKSKQTLNLVSSKRTTQLSKRTMANWNKKKVTYPPDIHFEPQIFFQLFNIETKLLLSDEDKEDTKSTEEEECDLATGDFQGEDDENHTDPSGEDNLPLSDITLNHQRCDTSPAGHSSTDDNADDNPDLNPDVNEEEVAGESDNAATSDDVYEGDNLVPMVKMVQVEPIRCVAKPNRVDFQHLKQVMLDVIQENIEDKENQNTRETPSGTVAFKDVLYELFNSNRLQHRTREDLSVAMAFLCLLTLTNEHSFCLNQPENSATEDIVISYEMTETN